MVEKNITKKYLQDRCTFKDKTVIIAVDFNGLYDIVKQFAPIKQKAIFKISNIKTSPLNDDQIDCIFPYLPKEVREHVDFVDLTKVEKLELIRSNKDNLAKILEKKGFTEQVELNSTITTPSEEYSSALLWDLIKTRADLV